MRRSVLFAVPAVLLLAPAVQASDATTSAPAEPAPEKKVCRSVMNTGSIMPKRICMTAKVWAEIDRQRNEQSADALERKGGIGGSTGGQN